MSGTRAILPTQQPGRMFEQISSLDFQMDETNSDTEWKWNIALEEMEKKVDASLQRIKRLVHKGWPDDMNGIEAAHHAAERETQGRQRRQKYIDYSRKGLRPRYLQRKTQEYLMENPNATWNDFSTRIIQRDVSFQVSSNFLNDEEQTKAQMATLGQEMKNLRSDLQEHRVNAVEGNPRTADPNQRGRQNAKPKTACMGLSRFSFIENLFMQANSDQLRLLFLGKSYALASCI